MWRERAACAGMPVAVFFPDSGGYGKTAKAICRTCPVTSECLTDAFNVNDQHAVLGGTNALDRQRLRAKNLTDPRDAAIWMTVNDAERVAVYKTRYRKDAR